MKINKMEEYLEIHESPSSNNNNEELGTFVFYFKKEKIGNIEIKNKLFYRNFISKLKEISSEHENHLENNYYHVDKNIFFVEFLCENNKLDIIKNIGNLDFNYENRKGETPLFSALISKHKNKNLIKYLLENKSDVNYVDKHNKSYLMHLTRINPNNNPTIPSKIEILLRNGANLNLITNNGNTIYEEMTENYFFFFRKNIFINPKILNYLPQNNISHFVTKLKKTLITEFIRTSDPFILNFYKFICNKFELINYDSDNNLKRKIKKIMRKNNDFSSNTLSLIISYIFFI